MSGLRAQRFDFRDAWMELSDGNTLTIAHGTLLAEEARNQYGINGPMFDVKGNQFMYNPYPQMEFTLTPDMRSSQPYELKRGPGLRIDIAKPQELETIVAAIVDAVTNELGEREGLDIDEHPERDDIIDTLMELVTTVVRDIK